MPRSKPNYKGWHITYSPKSIPVRQHDWEAVHDDYDGPPDNRCVTGKSMKDVVEQIDAIEEKH